MCVCVPCSSSRRKQRERQTSSPGRCDITLLPFNGHYESVAISDVVTNVSPLSLSPLSLSLSLCPGEDNERDRNTNDTKKGKPFYGIRMRLFDDIYCAKNPCIWTSGGVLSCCLFVCVSGETRERCRLPDLTEKGEYLISLSYLCSTPTYSRGTFPEYIVSNTAFHLLHVVVVFAFDSHFFFFH